MSSIFSEVTLAMDLSLSSPGFAVIALYEGKPIVLNTCIIKTDPKKSHGQRIAQIRDEVEDLIRIYNPEHFVREKGFSRFPTVTQTLFKVVGAIDVIVYDMAKVYNKDHKVNEIAVTSVKKLVTGNGKATKEEVAKEVFKLYQIDNVKTFYTIGGKLMDDKTDALAVGYAFYRQEGFISEE